MKRIKILSGDTQLILQENIDEWIAEENPEIISCSIAINDEHYHRYIAIVYDDNAGLKI